MKKISFLFFCIVPFILFGAGGSITSNRYNNSLIGGTGPLDSQGSSGTFSSSYGQLSLSSSQYIRFFSPDTYVALPFNTFAPSSNVNGSTSSPATITILDSGVYQLSLSVYFSSEDSNEGTFTQATYTLGASTDGGATVVPVTAVYAGEPGFFSLSYNALVTYSASDTVQFYMKASALGGGIYNNTVQIVSSNAYVMQVGK